LSAAPLVPSTSAPAPYRADYDSLPLDFQVLANPYLLSDMDSTGGLVQSDSTSPIGASVSSTVSPQPVSSTSPLLGSRIQCARVKL
jgi:hypothetical protein